MDSNVITALITLFGIISTAIIGYFVGRRQQSANAAKTEAETRIAEGVAEVAKAKQAVEVRLLDIEAKQAEIGYYKDLLADMKARDKERSAEQEILIMQVAEIKQVQSEAKNLQDQHIAELLTNIDGLIVSLGAADEKIVTLQTQVTEGNELIAALQLEVQGSNEIITALQTQVVGLQEEVREGNAIITTLREEIKMLLVKLVEKDKEVLASENLALKASE